MKRTLFFVYGLICYVLFFATFLYLIGFIGNLVVPKTIDGPLAADAGGSAWLALLVNTALLALFGIQHSVMARPAFKQWWTTIVPKPIERSTYVLATSLCLVLLYVAWQPLPGVVWAASGAVAGVLTATFFLGWATVLYSTFLIDHFDLFGLRQVFLHLKDREVTPKPFMTPSLYKLMRHPLYLGWLLCFWATPVMTVGHLLFAVVLTGYIFAAIPLEERDLELLYGDAYARYRERTPKIFPRLRRRADRRRAVASATTRVGRA